MIDLRQTDSKRLEKASYQIIEVIGKGIQAFIIQMDREIKISIDRGGLLPFLMPLSGI